MRPAHFIRPARYTIFGPAASPRRVSVMRTANRNVAVRRESALLTGGLEPSPAWLISDTGLTLTGAGANIAGANPDWVNPNSITTNNGAYDTTVVLASGSSDALAATTFGFAIPASDAIAGVQVDVDRSFAQSGNTFTVSLTKNGTAAVGTSKTITTGTGVASVGGMTELWDTTFSESEVEAATFGALIVANVSVTGETFSIDDVQIRVYYYDPTPTFYTPSLGTRKKK